MRCNGTMIFSSYFGIRKLNCVRLSDSKQFLKSRKNLKRVVSVVFGTKIPTYRDSNHPIPSIIHDSIPNKRQNESISIGDSISRIGKIDKWRGKGGERDGGRGPGTK